MYVLTTKDPTEPATPVAVLFGTRERACEYRDDHPELVAPVIAQVVPGQWLSVVAR